MSFKMAKDVHGSATYPNTVSRKRKSMEKGFSSRRDLIEVVYTEHYPNMFSGT